MAEIFDQVKRFFTEELVLEHDLHYRSSNRLMATLTFELPFVSVALYLLMVFGLPRLLKDSKPVKLPFIMGLWNLSLSILSLFIVIGVGIPYFTVFWQKGLYETVCDPDKDLYKGASVLLYWSYIFALSKYAELLDTLFVILRDPNRPVMFLHWYHHTTVLLFTWFAEYWRFSVGFIFIFVNAVVHTFMYWYYFQTGRGVKVSWAKALTIGQIAQMFLGIAANGYWMYNWYIGKECGCDNPQVIVWACIIMYGSYLLLFLKFFFERYAGPKKAGGSSSEGAGGKRKPKAE